MTLRRHVCQALKSRFKSICFCWFPASDVRKGLDKLFILSHLILVIMKCFFLIFKNFESSGSLSECSFFTVITMGELKVRSDHLESISLCPVFVDNYFFVSFVFTSVNLEDRVHFPVYFLWNLNFVTCYLGNPNCESTPGNCNPIACLVAHCV